MKSIFSIAVAALLLMVAFAQTADAGCVDEHGRTIAPVAVADAAGNVVVKTPTGTLLHVSGMPPFSQLCSNLLFESAAKLCKSGNAKVEAPRAASFCKKGAAHGDIGCRHIACVPGPS